LRAAHLPWNLQKIRVVVAAWASWKCSPSTHTWRVTGGANAWKKNVTGGSPVKRPMEASGWVLDKEQLPNRVLENRY
jgi:hypothetical protein